MPAASVEFDQREVVEVINIANVRKYTDFTNTPCAAPSNVDLTQLRKAIEGFIRTVPIPTWYIDTHVVWTVHGTGAMYADLNAALEALSLYIITHNGQVTLSVAAGRWVYGTAQVTLDHPNADRIILTGQNLTGDAIPGDFAVTGFSAAARSNDRTHTLNQLRTRYTTELDFTGGGGIISNCTSILVKNLLLVGDRSGGATLLSCTAGILNIDKISCCNSAGSGFGVSGGIIILASGSYCSASGSVGHGIALSSGGNICHTQYTTIYVTSNDFNGIGAGFDCGANGYAVVYANGNGGCGLSCTIIGQFQTGDNSQFNTNAQPGVFIDQGSFYTGVNSQFYNNGAAGLYVTVASNAQAGSGSSFSGNVGNSVVCGGGSYCGLSGAVGVIGSCGPAANTLSADGSYIAV